MANVPDYGVEEVADSTLSLILNLVGSSSCLLFSHSRAAMATLTSQASRAAAQMRKTHVLANGTKENKWPTHAAKGGTRLALALALLRRPCRVSNDDHRQAPPGSEERSWASSASARSDVVPSHSCVLCVVSRVVSCECRVVLCCVSGECRVLTKKPQLTRDWGRSCGGEGEAVWVRHLLLRSLPDRWRGQVHG